MAARQQWRHGAKMINDDRQAPGLGLLDTWEIVRIIASSTARIDPPMWLRSEPYLWRRGFAVCRGFVTFLHNRVMRMLVLYAYVRMSEAVNSVHITNSCHCANISYTGKWHLLETIFGLKNPWHQWFAVHHGFPTYLHTNIIDLLVPYTQTHWRTYSNINTMTEDTFGADITPAIETVQPHHTTK